ncbi:MAG: UDP-N-acetylglucosamine 2-epimerase (non-hydrolyzing), partial [Ignavibacteriaceae bacterium]|nr:UDP-N-acetylglucosamine 2-epimerase (non-hydrolyzing) [Ignavibacteriaceae bacterium]
HTGQHYDEKMSKVFFEDLELPKPDFYLGIGSGSHAEQTAKVMIEFEKILLQENPDLVIVVGDVNSTIACSLVAVKLGIKVAHVEAGLRSNDRTMPEEINRLLTDSISDYLFVTEKSGLENLLHEGVPPKKIFFTGNVMIDSLVNYLPKAEQSERSNKLDLLSSKKDLSESFNPSTVPPYILLTFHRPANVDSEEFLKNLITTVDELSKHRKIVFPVHPRTRNNMEALNLNFESNANVILTDPIGYIDFLALTKNAELIITDSGGIQEESTYLGVQCITVRDNTERPSTVDVGTNQLVGTDLEAVKDAAIKVLNGERKSGGILELWDGKAAKRIVEIIAEKLE